jgi:transposase InsO family protein
MPSRSRKAKPQRLLRIWGHFVTVGGALFLSDSDSRRWLSQIGETADNGFAERLIGSIRREYLNHIAVSGEPHLRRVLQTYAGYYNKIRTHRSLDKDAPISRPVQPTGSIKSHPILGGLHHYYIRA